MMRVLLIGSLFALSVSAFAQSQKEIIAANPEKAGGVYYVYDFNTPALTPSPKGYTPCYITHYGRHGSRYIEHREDNDYVLTVLDSLSTADLLTEYGKDVYSRFKTQYAQMLHHEGELTKLGWEQHYKNGTLMFAAYPKLFRRDPQIMAMSTLVCRCVMSMNAFCSGLHNKNPQLKISQDVSALNLPSLNPHSSSNPFRTDHTSLADRYTTVDPWGGKLSDFIGQSLDCKPFISRLTSDAAYFEKLCDPALFMRNLYYFVVDEKSIETDVDLSDVFTKDELYALWRIDNYMYWVEDGPLSTRDLSVVENFMSLIDRDLASGVPLVRLRFGHDSVLLVLLSNLGVNGMDKMPSSADEIEKTWQCYNTPMGATFYLVFYRGGANDPILFKAVLNGHECTLPIQTDCYPYYRWEDFRKIRES